MGIEQIDDNLNTGPQYTDTGPGRTQGPGTTQQPGGPPPTEEREIFLDQLVEGNPRPDLPPRAPPIDAPELPIPTLQGINRKEIKQKILEDIRKKSAAGTGGAGGSLATNLWMARPSWMVAMMNKSMDLLSLASQNRYQESLRKQETDLKMAKVGIESANVEKDMKMAQSEKEKLSSMGHVLGAATATIQLASMPGARGKAQQKVEEGEAGKARANEKAKLKEMEEDAGIKATEDKPDGDFTKVSKDQEKEIKAQRKKVGRLDEEVRRELQAERQEQTTQLDTGKRIVDGIFNGILESKKSLVSEQEADLAKQKGMNDVLQQTLNKASDGINKSKDEDLATINKINDTMKQTSEHNQRTYQLKG